MNNVIISETKPAECSDCKEIKELRPYGKDGSWVCFACAMKDEETAIHEIKKLFTTRDI